MHDNTARLRGRRNQARRLRLWIASPYCAVCGKRVLLSECELDHRRALFLGGEDRDENLQVLCAGPFGCHAKKTASENPGIEEVSFFPEWLTPAACHLTIVFGAPGSGKSTYVRQHATPDDRVIDLDEIVGAIAGRPIYTAGPEWLKPAARLRNKMLSALASPPFVTTWFITTGMGKADQQWWIKKLQPAHHTIMAATQADCIARVRADRRRPPEVARRHVDAIRAWFAANDGHHTVPTARRVAIGLDGFQVGG